MSVMRAIPKSVLASLAVGVLLTVAPVQVGGQTAGIGNPPGQLISIGDRKLHLHCTGTGTPTIILEAGASAFAIDWSLVQPEVARGSRVCSYDRARHGWSDPSPSVGTPEEVVRDLRAVLLAAKVSPPYVLVGASMGGIYVRMYQLHHPGDVVGLVLVDPSSEDGLFTRVNGKGVAIASVTAEQLRSTLPSGPIRIPTRSPQTGPPFDRLPPSLYKTRIALDARLIASDTSQDVPAAVVLESAEGQRAALAALKNARERQSRPLSSLPIVVLTRGDGNAAAHSTLAQLSTNARHTVVSGAGHEIHLFQPSAVIQAIQDVVASVASKQPIQGR